jgi:hypothetical protein
MVQLITCARQAQPLSSARCSSPDARLFACGVDRDLPIYRCAFSAPADRGYLFRRSACRSRPLPALNSIRWWRIVEQPGCAINTWRASKFIRSICRYDGHAALAPSPPDEVKFERGDTAIGAAAPIAMVRSSSAARRSPGDDVARCGDRPPPRPKASRSKPKSRYESSPIATACIARPTVICGCRLVMTRLIAQPSYDQSGLDVHGSCGENDGQFARATICSFMVNVCATIDSKQAHF